MGNALVRRFEELNPGYTAEIDLEETYAINGDDFWNVYITDNETGLTSHYVFVGREDFADWIEGVVLD